MRTNIDLDDELIEEAMRASGARTKKEAVDLGLRALIREKKRKNLLDLAGQIDFYDGFDPKAGPDRDLK